MLIYSSKNYIGAELSVFGSPSNDPTKLVIYHYLKGSTWLVDLRSWILPPSIFQTHRVAFSIYATGPLC